MKVVFVGPTLPDVRKHVATDIVVEPPARMGDVIKAVENGATVIGLIDGYFGDVLPIWHKEILYALSRGVLVLGAASMGALRAAECAQYGMIGVGKIFEQYANGELVDDADVAQLHGPEPLGYISLSEPLVNVIATLDHLLDGESITATEHTALAASARRLFFKVRVISEIVEGAVVGNDVRAVELLHLLTSHAIYLKRKDALELVSILNVQADALRQRPSEWTFNVTTLCSHRPSF